MKDERKNDAWIGEIAESMSLQLWVDKLTVGEYSQIRKLVCDQCDWSITKWRNKVSGKTKLTKLEKNAINEIAGYDIFKAASK